MALRMLYSCGFRLGELLAIRVGDFNFERSIVLLRDTKNKKQCIVPLGGTLTEMLYKYCLPMGLIECAENYVFPGKDSTYLSINNDKDIASATISKGKQTF